MTLRILAYHYETLLRSRPKSGGKLCDGVCDFEKRSIVLRRNMQAQNTYQALWHEVWHAVIDQHPELIADIKDNDDAVEARVDALATITAQLVPDNKALHSPAALEEFLSEK